MKNTLATLTSLVVAGSAWYFGAPQPAAQAQLSSCPVMTVTGNFAYVKGGPSLGYRTLRTAKHNERLNTTGAAPRGGWYQITSGTGSTGWVHRSVARCATPTSNKTVGRLGCANVVVTGPQGAWFKTKPSARSSTFRTAARGETLMLESPGTPIEYAGWYQIRHMPNNNLYWVHHSVITCK
ncbi:MAG: hypothetical protein CVV27_10870 [Candidatus Melainabacteria bacterium HGW-Melainabacteria-1]|nr:MAG: hypothetical protein CVV27_10870 [Candidatus Melainabacteria bacterium HGW-Melainabacteria-1]